MLENKIVIKLTYDYNYAGLESLISGSNLGPPGIAMFSALAVKNDFGSNK